jgi:hypothetical protein
MDQAVTFLGELKLPHRRGQDLVRRQGRQLLAAGGGQEDKGYDQEERANPGFRFSVQCQ